MNKKFGIITLIFCFGLSSVNLGWATQIIEVSPIIVQPTYDLAEINQQMLAQDRINRDQELAIKGLIDDNQKLTNTALATKQDATLEEINQTLKKYRDYLSSRDQVRIEANNERFSKYHDLIRLTEDIDDIKDAQGIKAVGPTLQMKSDMIEEKYKALSALKGEMIALNEKLKAQGVHESFNTASPDQEAKILMLTQRLAQMDEKISHYDEILAQKDRQIAQLKGQVDLLKTELENKITQENNQTPKEVRIATPIQVVPPVQVEPAQIQPQAVDLKAKDESIRWLNKVLAVTKNKAEYYRLTAEQDQSTLQQVQGEVSKIKDDFKMRFKDYDQFENAIVSLKGQVSQLGVKLSEKKQQVTALKSELENKISQENDQKDQIEKMKNDLRSILDERAKKEIYLRNESLQRDDRIKLAKQLIDLQNQETVLLDEKDNLEAAQSALFDQHATALEAKIKELLSKHQIQAADIQNRMEELKNELDQKEQQVTSLKAALQNKIAEEKSQSVLADQIQDLKSQLQGKEDQIAAMKAQIESGKETQAQADVLKQELADQQVKLDSLKQELEDKNSQLDKMTGMMNDYQKKLESKNDAYNTGLKQTLAVQNEQVRKIDDLNVQLQEKEAQIVKIKKDLYDLQEWSNAKDKDIQTRDLNLSMIQEKVMDGKIKDYQEKVDALQATNARQVEKVKSLKMELALARQQIKEAPGRDELSFLRTGLEKALAQIKQKDGKLFKIKANVDEYAKEYRKQTREFQGLTQQLLKARQDIDRKDEDLKYKNLEIARLKDLARKNEAAWKAQVKALTQRIDADRKGLTVKPGNEFFKNDPVEEKLKQALDKIDQQGRVINVLVAKLQDAGQTVDLAGK